MASVLAIVTTVLVWRLCRPLWLRISMASVVCTSLCDHGVNVASLQAIVTAYYYGVGTGHCDRGIGMASVQAIVTTVLV